MTSSNPIASALESLYSDLSSGSRRQYECDWRRYTDWLAKQGIDPLDATPKVIKAHVVWLKEQKNRQGKPFSKSTVSKALSIIREVYRTLVNDEVIEVNPAREAKTPKISSAPHTPLLTEAQVVMFLDAQPSKTWRERRDKLILWTLFGLGFRRSEVARMRGEDFDGATVTVMVKGGKTITVGVPAWLMKEIANWCKYAGIEDGPLFPWSQDELERPITGEVVYGVVDRAEKRAGFPEGTIAPHGLRRTNITLAGEKGVSLKARQLAVGHSPSATTEKYDHARDAAKNAPGDVFADLMKRKRTGRGKGS